MTSEQKKTLRKIFAGIRRHTPIVRKRLARGGKVPDRALVYSIAKYYEALEKLAKE
jgi:hypothetical protein